MKNINNKIFIFLIVAVLAFAFFGGQNLPDATNINTDAVNTESVYDMEDIQEQTNFKDVEIDEQSPADPKDTAEISAVTEAETEIDRQNAVELDNKDHTCTLSVKCDTIYNNIERIDREKTDFIPDDGVIFAEQTVSFEDGETVFDILLREMKRQKIHLEFVNTPVYNNAYIEGIANIYEFDFGELSGWMYKVNGVFPNFGCSSYQLKAGDKVEWVYTCNLGADVGGEYSARNGR